MTMTIDIVLAAATSTIAAFVSYALWKARRNARPQIRRGISLALVGTGGIMLAKLVQLAVLATSGHAADSTGIVDFANIAAAVVVAVGIALLAIGFLDMLKIGKHRWPKSNEALSRRTPGQTNLAGTDVESGSIPAILFRRGAPLIDNRVSSVFLNEKAEDLLGFTREEMQSDPHILTWLMHPEDRQDFLAGDDRLSTGESEAVFDHRFKHRSGNYRWIRTVMKRIDDPSGAFGEIVGCGLDITDLKEAEQQLASILSTDPCSVIPEDEIM